MEVIHVLIMIFPTSIRQQGKFSKISEDSVFFDQVTILACNVLLFFPYSVREKSCNITSESMRRNYQFGEIISIVIFCDTTTLKYNPCAQ